MKTTVISCGHLSDPQSNKSQVWRTGCFIIRKLLPTRFHDSLDLPYVNFPKIPQKTSWRRKNKQSNVIWQTCHHPSTHKPIFFNLIFLQADFRGPRGASPSCHEMNAGWLDGWHHGQATSSVQGHIERQTTIHTHTNTCTPDGQFPIYFTCMFWTVVGQEAIEWGDAGRRCKQEKPNECNPTCHLLVEGRSHSTELSITTTKLQFEASK